MFYILLVIENYHNNKNIRWVHEGHAGGGREIIQFVVALTMKRMRAVESDSVKSARKAKDKLHKACERASETH